MLGRFLGLAACAVLAVPAAPLNAAQPLGQWKLEPSDARCVAARQYGTAEKPINLALKASPIGGAVQLAIIRHAYRDSSGQKAATVDIDGKVFSTYALVYPLGYPAKRSKQSVTLLHLPIDAATAMRNAGNLGVRIREISSDQFPLGSLTAAWTDMEACLKRLRETWNIGEEHAVRIASPASAIVPMEGMFSGMDYPPQAAWKSFGGTTSVLLLIDEVGAIKDCTLTESSGMAVIDSRTCALITYKARFKPAVGSSGKAIKSTYSRSITWRVEG